MEYRFLSQVPKPLLDDLVQGRVLPIVGAGLSRNAIVPDGTTMPLWDGLGKALAEEIQCYSYSGSLDAISAYAHEYTRTKLVERLSELLLIDRATPGEAHRAFCSLPFTLVCTTNFDLLLERQYMTGPTYCRPVVDEEQLSVCVPDSHLILLKLHGDLHHPQRLVVTEEDYDRFLDAYPLMSTYLANLLITRTPLLIGYSLDDPDFRHIWQVVSDRLGRYRRPAYALRVDASSTETARFLRRGVRVINLPGTVATYGNALASLFNEMREYWSANLISASQVTEEEPIKDLSLPPGARTRLCFFAVPLPLLPFYREHVFPLAEEQGFVPISATDMISPGENWIAKIQSLIERSSAMLVDVASQSTLAELGFAVSKVPISRILVVVEERSATPGIASNLRCVVRPTPPNVDANAFCGALRSWFGAVSREVGPELLEEPQRLLRLQQYRAAIISAVILLEVRLRDRLGQRIPVPGRTVSMSQLVALAEEHGVLDTVRCQEIRQWTAMRNRLAHSLAPVQPEVAAEVVNGVIGILGEIGGPP